MKKSAWIIAVLLLLVLAGCCEKNPVNEPMELPDNAYIDRLFFADENLYAVRHAGGAAYITHESADPVVCYRLVDLPGGNESDTLWHPAGGRLYYSDGHQVYGSDLTGNDKELLWEFSRKSKEDRVRVMAITHDRLLICGSYWWAGQYPTSDYYSVDLSTGEAIKLMGDVAVSFKPVVLCCYENTALLVQKDGKNWHVLSCNLLTGESKELGRFDYEETIYDADGAVLNDTLYFVFENDGIYSVPLSGGEVEYRWPDTALVLGMDRLIDLEAYDGELYVLMRDGADKPPAALCRWEPETGILCPAATADGTSSVDGFSLADGTYYLFGGTSFLSGELSAGDNVNAPGKGEDLTPTAPDGSALQAAALERLRGLQPEEISEIQYRETDLAELTALIRAAAEHNIHRNEDLHFAAWDMTVSLSANTEEDWTLESIWFGAGSEEEIVQVRYRFRDDLYDRALFLADRDLYWFIRNGYSTVDVIDEETIVAYRDILEEQARKTKDEYGRLLGTQPFFWCEIISFELVDSFRQDGEDYAVYEWDAAFLTKEPAKVCWENGMWLDNQCRVRALEEKTYFVIRSSEEPAYSSAMVDYRFFSWDLYSVLDEETGNAYARTAITEAFRSDLHMRVYCLNLPRESVRRSNQEFNHTLEKYEEPVLYIWSDEKRESPLATEDNELLCAISSAADCLQAIERPDSIRTLEGGFYIVLDGARSIALFAGEEPNNVLFRYAAPDVNEAAVVYDPQLYLYLAASAESDGANQTAPDLTDLDHDGFFEAVFGDRSSGSLMICDYYENAIHRIDTNQTIGCVVSTDSLPANIQAAYRDMIQAQGADGTVSVYSYKDGTFVYEGLLKECLKSEP